MSELYHYGVKGMRWGVRKNYQNENGTLTEKGKRKYGINDSDAKEVRAVKTARANYKIQKRQYDQDFNDWYGKSFAAYSPSRSHRMNNDKRFQNALISAGDLQINKQEYKRLKASMVGKTRQAEIARKKAQIAKNAKTYNVKISDMMEKGYTMSEAGRKLERDGTYEKFLLKQRRMEEDLRRIKKTK